MSNKVLVRFKASFDSVYSCSGFKVFDKDRWEQYVGSLSDDLFPYTHYCPIRGYVVFEDLQDYLQCISITPLTDKALTLLEKHFSGKAVEGGDFVLIAVDSDDSEEQCNSPIDIYLAGLETYSISSEYADTAIIA